jgi:hypothetical protein
MLIMKIGLLSAACASPDALAALRRRGMDGLPVMRDTLPARHDMT